MYLFILFLLALFFLTGTFFLTSLCSAFRRAHKRNSKKEIKSVGKIFFYRPFHLFFFPTKEYESLFFAVICAQSITRFGFAAAIAYFLMSTNDAQIREPWFIVYMIGFILLSFVIGDFLPRIIGTKHPEGTIRLCAPFSSIFLFLAFPITYLFLNIAKHVARGVYLDISQEPTAQAKQEIIEIIQKASLSPTVDFHEKKLIESVLSFKERIAREVMVPRVDVFSLSAETKIKEAAERLYSEGYSRTPVYQNTVDNIVGVLMYKDVLAKYMEYEQKKNDPKILDAPISTIQKNILYTPETKKISSLLQEFRKKQVHLAIVVDEYGGTEGIVTIEDILEEIVGDISDEYDTEEEQFIVQPDGSWLVDARMNILDAEEHFGIKIPQEGDYDTIGGYIFHAAGSIPSKGFRIHQENFEMEVLLSNERSVEKVRITPLGPTKDDALTGKKAD